MPVTDTMGVSVWMRSRVRPKLQILPFLILDFDSIERDTSRHIHSRLDRQLFGRGDRLPFSLNVCDGDVRCSELLRDDSTSNRVSEAANLFNGEVPEVEIAHDDDIRAYLGLVEPAVSFDECFAFGEQDVVVAPWFHRDRICKPPFPYQVMDVADRFAVRVV